MNEPNPALLTLTADIVAAHVSNNSVAISDLPSMIGNVYASLAGLGQSIAAPEAEEIKPAANPRTSVKPDAITSLIDGRPYKILKRHLANHGFTPESYRKRFGLAPSYPMVAPNYAAQRRALALKIGLGTQRRKH